MFEHVWLKWRKRNKSANFKFSFVPQPFKVVSKEARQQREIEVAERAAAEKEDSRTSL